RVGLIAGLLHGLNSDREATNAARTSSIKSRTHSTSWRTSASCTCSQQATTRSTRRRSTGVGLGPANSSRVLVQLVGTGQDHRVGGFRCGGHGAASALHVRRGWGSIRFFQQPEPPESQAGSRRSPLRPLLPSPRSRGGRLDSESLL